jgi:hypothetical protein
MKLGKEDIRKNVMAECDFCENLCNKSHTLFRGINELIYIHIYIHKYMSTYINICIYNIYAFHTFLSYFLQIRYEKSALKTV